MADPSKLSGRIPEASQSTCRPGRPGMCPDACEQARRFLHQSCDRHDERSLSRRVQPMRWLRYVCECKCKCEMYKLHYFSYIPQALTMHKNVFF